MRINSASSRSCIVSSATTRRGEGMIAIPGMVDANARMRSLDPGLLTLGPPPNGPSPNDQLGG